MSHVGIGALKINILSKYKSELLLDILVSNVHKLQDPYSVKEVRIHYNMVNKYNSYLEITVLFI